MSVHLHGFMPELCLRLFRDVLFTLAMCFIHNLKMRDSSFLDVVYAFVASDPPTCGRHGDGMLGLE